MKDKIFGILQRVGRSFMLPIAILPVAGLLLGVGGSLTNETMIRTYGLQEIMGSGTLAYTILSVCSKCGNVVFENLPLIFAIGVAIGMARAEKEVAALSAAIAFFVMHTSISTMLSATGAQDAMKAGMTAQVVGIQSLQMGVFGGVVVGMGVAALHNRFYKIKLPEIFSFFGGTRFVPIISGLVYVFVGVLMFFCWPPIQKLMYAAGGAVTASGYLGTFVYGVMERALIPFGLHHVFYLPFWQTSLGGTMEVSGKIVEGAQNIFFAQLADPGTVHFAESATRFMTGKFPLMIFGLPGAALAMYKCSQPQKRKAVGGLLISAALTSMLTGITEPLEFTFLFVAPGLYVIHCVFAGAAYMLMHILKVCVGMTFSGGMIDMFLFGVLQGQDKTNWMLFLPVGALYFAVYFFLFGFIIRKYDLETPGREKDRREVKLYTRADTKKAEEISGDDVGISARIAKALGGKDNIRDIDCCVTRLRCTVGNPKLIDEELLKCTGSRGIVKRGDGIQIIYGPMVTVIKSDLEAYLKTGKETGRKLPVSEIYEERKEISHKEETSEIVCMPMNGEVIELSEVEDEVFSEEMLGEGFAIRPKDGMVSAPVNGIVSAVFPTKHAMVITSDAGAEVLIHMGLETVKLDGMCYDIKVEPGMKVRTGDLLAEILLDRILEAGYHTTTPIVISNSMDYKAVVLKTVGECYTGTEVLELIR